MADNNKTSTQAQGSGGEDNKVTAPPKPVQKSRSKTAKEGFGSWPNFMHSYQLKTWEPDDVEEGNQILDTLRQSDFEDKMEEYQEQLHKEGK